MKLDVLIVGAHPDDVEISCGGTILKLVRHGKKVGVIDLTEGELGTRGTREIRVREASEASSILGISVRENLKIADGNIEPTAENRLKLVRAIRAYRPSLMIFPYSIDRHPDHESAHALSRQAWFQAGLEKIRTKHEGKEQEPFRPASYINFMQWHEFTPSFIVDISGEFEERMKAVRAFKSQFYDPASQERETVLSSPEFLRLLTSRLAYYGTRIGRQYGEPFFFPGTLGVSNFEHLIF